MPLEKRKAPDYPSIRSNRKKTRSGKEYGAFLVGAMAEAARIEKQKDEDSQEKSNVVNIECFKSITAKVDVAQGLIHKHREDFQKLRYSIDKFDSQCAQVKEHWIGFDKLKGEDQQKIINEIESAYEPISMMYDDLKLLLSTDVHMEEKRNKDRKGRIEELLRKLPEICPTLKDLPRDRWWKLYIDAPLHEQAEKMSDPGRMFDEDSSPGYQRSMLELFDKVLVPIQKNRQKSMHYEEYIKIHDLSTEYCPNRDDMRKDAGAVITNSTFNHGRYGTIRPKTGEDLQDRVAAFQEIENEFIDGLPLFGSLPFEDAIDVDGCSRQIVTGRVNHGDIPIPDVRFPTGCIEIASTYPREQIPHYINTILESYYESQKTANGRYHIIKNIAKATRTLNVLHPKMDANGRTNVNTFMNKCLIEEGLSPTILPNDPEIFNGEKTLDRLVEDVLIGMHSFIREVNQNSPSVQ